MLHYLVRERNGDLALAGGNPRVAIWKDDTLLGIYDTADDAKEAKSKMMEDKENELHSQDG